MSLRINTNVAALVAHKNMVRNDAGLSSSLEKLSSGLRINRAADDASGMAIADSLRFQALGLGQAIRNANDGISMVQTADGALEESINIINTIKTKAIQAAQEGQTLDSRKAIQADIDKLMEEMDMIARTTSFNGQKLLSGSFVNKEIQVGAYTGETMGISIASSESNKVGHLSTEQLNFTAVGTVDLTIASSLQDLDVDLQIVTLAFDNTAASGSGAVADLINRVSNDTGITGQAVVEINDGVVVAGDTGADFEINGTVIGEITVVANDADGALVSAINQKTDEHGVLASVNVEGELILTSADGRGIEVVNTGAVVTAATELGYVKLYQIGANNFDITQGGTATYTETSVTKYTLSDVDVTSQDDAQVAISVADSALRSLDKVRSDLGSAQNQLASTISNISVTRVNIYAAESAIRDVDFAEEASTFAKMQILVQSSSFAMAQANASSQNVLSLLQGA